MLISHIPSFPRLSNVFGLVQQLMQVMHIVGQDQVSSPKSRSSKTGDIDRVISTIAS